MGVAAALRDEKSDSDARGVSDCDGDGEPEGEPLEDTDAEDELRTDCVMGLEVLVRLSDATAEVDLEGRTVGDHECVDDALDVALRAPEEVTLGDAELLDESDGERLGVAVSDSEEHTDRLLKLAVGERDKEPLRDATPVRDLVKDTVTDSVREPRVVCETHATEAEPLREGELDMDGDSVHDGDDDSESVSVTEGDGDVLGEGELDTDVEGDGDAEEHAVTLMVRVCETERAPEREPDRALERVAETRLERLRVRKDDTVSEGAVDCVEVTLGLAEELTDPLGDGDDDDDDTGVDDKDADALEDGTGGAVFEATFDRAVLDTEYVPVPLLRRELVIVTDADTELDSRGVQVRVLVSLGETELESVDPAGAQNGPMLNVARCVPAMELSGVCVRCGDNDRVPDMRAVTSVRVTDPVLEVEPQGDVDLVLVAEPLRVTDLRAVTDRVSEFGALGVAPSITEGSAASISTIERKRCGGMSHRSEADAAPREADAADMDDVTPHDNVTPRGGADESSGERG